ncbi:UDP-3-O-acyl-N-acetylglucosamine deacetylase [Candidatus Dependentiae bacterium]|nr:UDP-3-O-acyl-N-acetylglucosamine deacetylase [Candidatus Dependentiae bacterium]MBU4387572.1 UDP-3-O-acyl-N-acetylglucosamine deacetylase [Candidatus Dependentiae bacterium]MCG2755901.1 UDP-3-O-acyl-N-acetylglucosamine deacetylase [Candidatus Dependentiae bacterium]
MFQRTINKSVSFSGIGVHFGLSSKIILHPAQIDSGIVFINNDLREFQIKIGSIIPQEAMHASVLKKDKFVISTLEHLMAAVNAFQIDNLLIEIQGVEVPILDGSCIGFVNCISKIGIKEQNKKKEFISSKQIISFNDEKNDRSISIYPAEKINGEYSNSLFFDYSADFSHPLVGKGRLCGELSLDYFIKEIAPARTFGFLDQLPFLKKHGLAKGTSLGNTVVIGQDDFINTPRFRDEFVRHKLLDLIGDLSLLGKNLAGKVVAKKTGHSFNRLVVQDYINNLDNWKLIN